MADSSDRTYLTEVSLENGQREERTKVFDGLLASDKFVLQRVIEPRQMWHEANTYKIASDEASLETNPEFTAAEHGEPSIWRSLLCCNQRKCDIKVTDKRGSIVLWLEHPANCNWPILCPSYRPSLTVRSSGGHVIGHVEHAPRETLSAMLSPSLYYDITDGDGKVLFKVEGPSCKFELFKTASFRLFSPAFNAYVGDIDHEWQGTCDGMFSCCVASDLDKSTITFPKELDVSEKALLLGTLVLTHLNYYEQV